jgi:protein regulator of cytokinesis 1
MTELQGTLEELTILLGPAFDLPQPVYPNSAGNLIAPRLCRVPSNSLPSGPKRSLPSGSNTLAQAIEDSKLETYLDVGETITETLVAAVNKGLIERVSLDGLASRYSRKADGIQNARRQQLEDSFRSLTWLHSELHLPPIPIAHPHHFPVQFLPSRQSEERPGAHAGYEKLLAKFAVANPDPYGENLPEGAEMAEAKGMEGVEAELGLLAWAQEVEELVRGSKGQD